MTVRFMFTNLITSASMLTSNSVAGGFIAASFKQGTGSATMETGGTYTGTAQLVYKVEIDSVAAGAEIGSATFKWSDDGGATWDATGVTTSTGWLTLNNGVQIRFTSGSGDDCVLGDYWVFHADAPFGVAKLIDLDRDSQYRAGGVANPEWIKVDLGSAKAVTAIVILDHNFTAAATVTLQANATDAWGAPSYSQAITYNADIMVMFLSQTYQWWRLTIADTANPDGYVAIGEMYLGTYTALTREARANYPRLYRILSETIELEHGGESIVGKNLGTEASLEFQQVDSTDYGYLVSLIEACYSKTTREFKPFYLCFNHSTPNDTLLMRIVDGLAMQQNILSRRTCNLQLREKLKGLTT